MRTKSEERNGNSGDAGFFESSGEEAGAESFSEGGEAIGKFGGGRDTALRGNFVEKVATEKLETRRTRSCCSSPS